MISGWLFLTPVFYPVEAIPPVLLPFLKLNPMFHFVGAYRAIILESRVPLPELFLAGLFTVGLSLAGFRFFSKTLGRAKDFI
jgi:ABC-type polysaccharide/polyol phosphate export permease